MKDEPPRYVRRERTIKVTCGDIVGICNVNSRGAVSPVSVTNEATFWSDGLALAKVLRELSYEFDPPSCVQCGKIVERERWAYVHPTCLACLPAPLVPNVDMRTFVLSECTCDGAPHALTCAKMKWPPEGVGDG